MSEGLRLAALRLHGVGAADREWILDRLERRERRTLVRLLRDLKRAGIGRDSFRAMGAEAAKPQPAARAEPAADVPAALAQADAETVARALRGEPEWVRATILAVHPWSWRRAVLQRLAGGDRTPPVLGTVKDAPRPAFAAALARSLARRVAERPGSGRTPFDRVMDNVDALARPPRPRLVERLRLWMR
jgi:hypothetical protein